MISDLCGASVTWTFGQAGGIGKVRAVYPGEPGRVARVVVEVTKADRACIDTTVGDLLDLNIQQVRVER